MTDPSSLIHDIALTSREYAYFGTLSWIPTNQRARLADVVFDAVLSSLFAFEELRWRQPNAGPSLN